MENKLFSSTLAKKKELKTYLVLFWDNAEYLGLYLAWSQPYDHTYVCFCITKHFYSIHHEVSVSI